MKQLSSAEQGLAEGVDQAAMLALTERWCAINSGTGNLEGLAEQATLLADAFAALPGEVALRQPAAVTSVDAAGNEIERAHGKHLVVRVRPQAERRFLLTGHMDTVYPPDHPFQTGTWLDNDTLNAPGAADMKGGLAVILHALLAFERSETAGAVGYDVLVNSDEETGSLSSAALIAELARGKAAALTYEPSALPDGTLAHARGGSGNYSLVVTGRSAHAGRNPQEGRNAIVAAAALALELKALEHAELSVNPAKIDGGSANNVVPDHAVLRFNIRPKSVAAAQAFEQALAALIRAIETDQGVAITRHGGITRPPKPVDARAQALFDLVADTSAALGRPLGWQASGGVCDGNNIAACGVPVVDTMGVRGGAIHSPDEYLIASSLSERAALSAAVLHRLASGALA
jgi:glutamate carboxypeptidase